MRDTSVFTVNDAGDPEAVVVAIDCKRITIGPQAGENQFGWKFRSPLAASPAMRFAAGQPMPALESTTFLYNQPVLTGYFKAGTIIGYAEMETGGGAQEFFMLCEA